MKNRIISLIAILILCVGCSNSALKNAGKETKDSVSNAVDSSNKYVLMVKNAHREGNPELSYDKAFSAFFGAPKWKYFESDEGQDVVEFTGDCTYQDVAVKARIQFVVDEENGTFEAVYLAFNEVPQNNLILAMLISKAFEVESEQVSTEVSAQTSSSYTGEILFNGDTVLNWLGARTAYLYDDFGPPVFGTPVDGYLYNGGEYYGYDGILFIVNYVTEDIGYIVGTNLSAFTIDGVKLDKNRTELLAIFGNPVDEEWSDVTDGYCMWFDYQECFSVYFEMPDPNSKAYEMWISYKSSSEATLNDDYYSSSSNDFFNSPLIGGKWVASNGDRIEFFSDETGTTNLDLWSWPFGMGRDTKDIFWKEEDGRLILAIQHIREGDITIHYDDNNGDYLTVKNVPERYKRVTETSGLYGQWMPVSSGGGGIMFNEDGTGHDQISRLGDFTWIEWDGVIIRTYFQAYQFDYTVQDSMLYLYGRDSVTIFSRVGGN